jgi:hypothetical protein
MTTKNVNAYQDESTLSKLRIESRVMLDKEDGRIVERFLDRIEKIAGAAGATLYECCACDSLFEKHEAVKIRECTRCAIDFDATNGRNCNECNSPFTKKGTDFGCPVCRDNEPLVWRGTRRRDTQFANLLMGEVSGNG